LFALLLCFCAYPPLVATRAHPSQVDVFPSCFALQLLPTMVGSRVRISASSCNIGIRDANCWFDSSALVRQFKLDLANPFERAVALLILYLIASHQTYIIGVSEYYDPDAKSTTNLGKFTTTMFCTCAQPIWR
jgi:hypothetical protein